MPDRTLTGDAHQQLVDAGVKGDDRAAPGPRDRKDERETTPRDRGSAGDAGRPSRGGSQEHTQSRKRS